MRNLTERSSRVPGMGVRLEPIDEYMHELGPESNFNESMYFNVYDPKQQLGGWFRCGNRPNEGYAEMTICIYLPDGRVAFMFGRPKIANNHEMNAGGLKIEVVEPFKKLHLTYDGKACVLTDPNEMAEPSKAFKNNPQLPCKIELDYEGVS